MHDWLYVEAHCTVVDTVLRHGRVGDAYKIVTDLLGLDWRYAIDTTKLQRDLGWQPTGIFATGIRKTVEWYVAKYKA